MKNTIIKKPPVRDRQKCQDIVVAYEGRNTGVYIENGTDTSFSLTQEINSSKSHNVKSNNDMSFKVSYTRWAKYLHAV